MNITKTLLTGIILTAATWTKAQTVVSATYINGGIIPVDSPVGLTSTGNFTAANPGDVIAGVTVDLNISGGYNGNLYAYLLSPNNVMVELMSEPGVAVNGFGASGPGMDITLSDTAAQNIQNETSGGILTGTYHPSGNLSDFGTLTLPGEPADGNWELFVADEASGGGVSTLNSWTLHVTTVASVPEPESVALLALGALACGGFMLRRIKSNPLARKPRI